MALGVVCHWLDDRGNNLLKASELRLGRLRDGLYTDEQITSTYVKNVQRHIDFLPTVISSGIRVFRLTSSLLTLADQVPEGLWRHNKTLLGLLQRLGDIVRNASLRLTMHPGQFAVLSSDDDRVVDNAIKDLSIHAFIMDAMGLPLTPFHAINVHGGKRGRSQRLIDTISSLPDNVRKRLTLENDESSYSVADLIKVHSETGTPVVFDSHHHSFNDDGMSVVDAFNGAVSTWSGVRPLQHISNTEPGREGLSFSERRKHSQYIHTIPHVQLKSLQDDTVDLEVEAKQKQLAVFQLAKDFNVQL
jgi:UV DNA damage endonuclease